MYTQDMIVSFRPKDHDVFIEIQEMWGEIMGKKSSALKLSAYRERLPRLTALGADVESRNPKGKQFLYDENCSGAEINIRCLCPECTGKTEKKLAALRQNAAMREETIGARRYDPDTRWPN